MFVNFGVSPLACLSSAVHYPLSPVRRLLCLPAILFSPCGQFVRETVQTLRLDSAQNEAKLALASSSTRFPAASVAAVAQLHRRGEWAEERGICGCLGASFGSARLVVEQFIIAANWFLSTLNRLLRTYVPSPQTRERERLIGSAAGKLFMLVHTLFYT